MTTDVVMLPKTVAEMRADWAADRRATKILDQLEPLATRGTQVWVYGSENFAATIQGLSLDVVEFVFGGTDQVEREFCPPLLAATRDDTGELVQFGPTVAARREDADRAWHILDADGGLLAGGPPIFDEARALEIAASYGDTCTVHQGIPAAGFTRPDDGLGTFDPENPQY